MASKQAKEKKETYSRSKSKGKSPKRETTYRRTPVKETSRTPGKRTEKKQRKAETEEEAYERKNKGKKAPRVRVFPIWLRILIFLALTLLALIAGLMIGYGIIGDGNPIDILKVETWRHIIDIVVKE
jgi:cobalamin biosynthesis Mg chelatase CobN